MKIANVKMLPDGSFDIDLDVNGLVQLYGLWRDGHKRWAEFQDGVRKQEGARRSAQSKKTAELQLIVATSDYEKALAEPFLHEVALAREELFPGSFLRLRPDYTVRRFVPPDITMSWDSYSEFPHESWRVVGGVTDFPYPAVPDWPEDWPTLQFDTGGKIHLRGHFVGCSAANQLDSSRLTEREPVSEKDFMASLTSRHCKHCTTSLLRKQVNVSLA